MRKHARTSRGIVAALLTVILLAGCAGEAKLNKPLAPNQMNNGPGPISRGGYHMLEVGRAQTVDTIVLLAFSGGGMRSAAFGYGVLKGMRDFPLVVDGHQERLLDEIDMMASVSGGSFPAAYYGLYRDKIFTDFEKDFLDHDISSYIWGTYLLPWHMGWLFESDHGTNDRMAEVYDDLMFHGATYADLLKRGRPVLSVDATDVDHEFVFPFLQDQFDFLCSDLLSYPISRAVAASNGFPILFSPITLKNYRAQCGGREPSWLKGDVSRDPLSRVAKQAEISRIYLDSKNTRYVHLLDGGISDNLAMRGMINTIMILTDVANAGTRFDFTHIRRVVLISSDGQAASNAATAKERDLSSLGQIFNAVSGTQIDSYNFETMILANKVLDDLRDTIRKSRCAAGPAARDGHPCDDVKTYFVHLSLAEIADPAERQRLQSIPTGLSLEPENAQLLEAAGQKLVLTSPELIAFRNGLNSSVAQTKTAPTAAELSLLVP
jgi:NTE family protein